MKKQRKRYKLRWMHNGRALACLASFRNKKEAIAYAIAHRIGDHWEGRIPGYTLGLYVEDKYGNQTLCKEVS